MVRSSDMEKEELKVLEANITEEEQAYQIDYASEEEDDLLQTSISNVASLDESSPFFVGCLSRFGQSININSRFENVFTGI